MGAQYLFVKQIDERVAFLVLALTSSVTLAGYLTSLSLSDHVCQMRIALVSVSRIIMRSKVVEGNNLSERKLSILL